MRLVIVGLLFITAGSVLPQTALSPYLELARTPKTVLDYFLLCPIFLLDDQGQLTWGSDPELGEDEYNAKKQLLTTGYSAGDFLVQNVVIDTPNAFIQVSGQQHGFPFTLTVVFFDRKGQSNIPAFSYISKDGTSDVVRSQMFELDPAGGWNEVTSDIVPDLRLEQLDNSSRKADLYPEVNWELVLPQKGTTVLAVPHVTSRMSQKDPSSEDYLLVKRLLSRKIELRWDRVSGLFTGYVK
jgi:hypothetical protein